MTKATLQRAERLLCILNTKFDTPQFARAPSVDLRNKWEKVSAGWVGKGGGWLAGRLAVDGRVCA